MAAGISIREFARREGCSDTLVRRAVKQRRLAALEDGSIDPALVGSAWRKRNATGANSANTGANSVRTVRSSQDAPETDSEPHDDESLEDAAQRMLAAGRADLDYAEALRVKENYLALLRKLEYRQKAGALIELATAEQVFFNAFRAQRDSWLNWPVKVGPVLAAELGLDEADRVTELLTAHVHKQIEQLGEPEPGITSGEAG